MSPRGRRPAGSDTRAQILAAASAEFAEQGYAATSLRGIARRAGVDPALVHHYFEGKPALLAEVLEVPVDPAVLIARVLALPREEVGAGMVRSFLSIWDDPAGRQRFAVVARSMIAQEAAARSMREFILREVFLRVAQAHNRDGLAPAELERRASLAVAQMFGMALLRYVVCFPALASATPEDLVADLGPVLQGYLAP